MNTVHVGRYEVAEVRLGSVQDGTSSLLDVTFVSPSGQQQRVPAFVTGDEWRTRYSSGLLGEHFYSATFVDGSALADTEGVVSIVERESSGVLRSHGPLRVAGDQRHLEHDDGTQFVWAADTWWQAFTQRISMDEYRALATKRADQGFSVVQLVAGFYPELELFAPEGDSQSGWPWHEGLTAPNLAWFDEADERIGVLVDLDLVPCIFGSWGQHFRWLSAGQMLRHWRELIARWGAMPVVWCLGGEINTYRPDVPELLAEHDERPGIEQLERFNAVAPKIRAMEPFGRLFTLEPCPPTQPWECLDDPGVVDIWMLQTGHKGFVGVDEAVDATLDAISHLPTKPVINGEACYEGIMGTAWQDLQRFMFWSHVLSGTAGHTYGAQGLWGFHTAEYTGSPDAQWGDATWQDAAELPGAAHIGLGRRILAELPWARFETHPEWVEPHQDRNDRFLCYAAGVPDGPRLVYVPSVAYAPKEFSFSRLRLCDLGTRTWHVEYVNPRTGMRQSAGSFEPSDDGTITLTGFITPLPTMEDWLILLRP